MPTEAIASYDEATSNVDTSSPAAQASLEQLPSVDDALELVTHLRS